MSSAHRPTLLCISQSFAPDTTPTAIRASKLLDELSRRWAVVLITESDARTQSERLRAEVVRSWRPRRALAAIRRLRLSKILDLLLWPDDSIFWILPAILAGRREIARTRPSAIVVFMMPYSAGIAGIILSRLSGLPLILNLDDSPTCTDMHPSFPTRLHYRMARTLEDSYASIADALIYVSQTNLDRARERQSSRTRGRLHLVRYGADRADCTQQTTGADFEIVYVGAMTGWWLLIEEPPSASPLRALYARWEGLGRYERARLDHRTSSPAFIGAAINDALAEHPDWRGRVSLTIYGNPYPPELVARALQSAGVQDVVTVHGPVPHEQVTDIICRADLLFLALPKRLDETEGGRISAKTYEYLAADRPILAALPRGENWRYLAGTPGVWLVAPDDRRAMRDSIVELAAAKFAGRPLTFDRAELQAELSYEGRARAFAAIIDQANAQRK